MEKTVGTFCEGCVGAQCVRIRSAKSALPVVQAYVNLLGISQARRGEVDIEMAKGHHRENIVARHGVRGLPKEVAEGDPGVDGDDCTYLLLGFRRD
jgi:hypothetical protein